MSKRTKRTALIDADILLYKAAFTAEYTVYVDKDNGHAWRYKKLVPKERHDALVPLTVVEGPDVALDAFRWMLLNCINNTNATHATLFLSPSKCFRNDIAKTLPYKGNRKDKPKPVYYDFLREVMTANYGAVMCDNIEADDALGIMQTALNERGESSVICSTDKDLQMIAGDHYNFTSKQNSIVTSKAANHNFYKQLLTGDMIDNIQGIEGVADITAEKILKGIPLNQRKLVVMEQYKKAFGKIANKRLGENLKLLKILTQLPEGQTLDLYDVQSECMHFDLTMSTDPQTGHGFRTK